MSQLISLAGRARVGKGTFVELSRQLLSPRVVTEVAFAFCLKNELDPALRALHGISAWTTDDAEKKVIRPYLVERGAGARRENPQHWIKLAEPSVCEALDRGDIVIVSDSRYRNECDWVHSLGGKVIYIERILPSGEPVPPANEEEAREDGPAREVSDYVISWPTFLTNPLDNMRPFVQAAWSQVGIQPVDAR
jgi:hypothetical protein